MTSLRVGVQIQPQHATFDGMHLKPESNAAVAEALADRVSKVAAAAKQ